MENFELTVSMQYIYVMVTGHSSKPGYFPPPFSLLSTCHTSVPSPSLSPPFLCLPVTLPSLLFIFSSFSLRLYISFYLFHCTIYDYAFISASLLTNFRPSLFYVYLYPVPMGCELISSVILQPHSSNRIHWPFT
jgi:hypothetical protein